jgi:hypothetical protein
MPEEKKRISAYVSTKLYTKLVQSEYSMTEAITKALEMFLELPREQEDANIPENEPALSPELLTGYQFIIENMEKQLKVKDDGFRERIEDMKEQLRVKDQQLSTKDYQLESKDSQLEKQAVHIQTLISQKAIEAPGAKRPWWRFW